MNIHTGFAEVDPVNVHVLRSDFGVGAWREVRHGSSGHAGGVNKAHARYAIEGLHGTSPEWSSTDDAQAEGEEVDCSEYMSIESI